MQRLSLKGMTAALAILGGGAVMFVGLINLFQPGYGYVFLDMINSIYPWCMNAAGWKWVFMASGCAVADGAVCGFLLAWIYNRFIPKT
ncbi:MAG: hypothetical protein BWY42_00892 [Candidatus Omnitrophica bacterium ADurb.Bin277]|nr:MAG: hypothetical protein BWY42_00892 [Candidatus Omnitrophica bacterium ADurb.Bin277]